ncbi:MAG: hypothetical protein PWP54_1440 [Thermosipho sp. (in: thermotogales)]|nr:hypothetical protein [Thermosipho sp. (in: thermotogales)]
MRKLFLGLVGILLVFVLFGCFLAPKPETLTPGYYVIFNFQYKASDGAEDITVLPGLKMEEIGNNEYKLSVPKSELASLLEGKDKDGVYWWTVAKVIDVDATNTWIIYGGTGAFDPSVPFLKEDFDALSDTDTVEFYAIIPDSTDTIVGFGDNLKDNHEYYFVGDVTGWSHTMMEYVGDGKFEATITANDYVRSLEYKIWPANEWTIPATMEALAFNGEHYYATGGNGTYDFTEDVKELKVVFDAHHSMISFEPVKATNIETIGSVKQRLLADDSATFTTTVRGVVTYDYSSYLIIQDDTDAIKVYKSGIGSNFDLGDLVLISGEASVYGHDFEIAPDASELISTGNPDPVPMDITGTFIDDASPLYGRLVVFTGTVQSTDTFSNVTFLSDGTEITVKDYVGYDWQTGVEYTVKGVIMWNYDRYKVVPRSVDDIVQGNAILIDGSLNDWQTLHEDATNDAYWSGNEIYKVGLSYDASYLYLAGDYSKGGTNNLMFLIDISSLTGSNTTINHPWNNRNYVFNSGDIDLVVETWGNGLAAWSVDGAGDFTDISGSAVLAYSGGLNDGEERITEIKIPWTSLGVTSTDNLEVYYAAVLTGGYDGTSQWLSDLAPEQDLINSQNPSPAATITNFYIYPELP